MIEYKEFANISLNINGEDKNVIVKPSDTLLNVIRDKLGLTGAKAGCENGDCGSCTVLIDGIPIKSCITLAVESIGKKIITIEGLKETPIQKAFIEKAGFQCGFCTCGFIMNCQGLITMNPNASDDIIDEWLSSNLCRCTSYNEISKAIKWVLKKECK
ncbi:(2Fe-2S)-binding protein [Paraclostridium ghonii]|uniref:(2Fe-2S)-binding protein n=1 Tax=Paraclostridium ghonii TaxID=29358 RepID=UPI00202CBD83|nr:(2Fe-2S)-binding protein [Paeniclostridium ghonii]MCM0166874.1 (2Fe-2S)-binding protein [Paeniclostridium ghonii]